MKHATCGALALFVLFGCGVHTSPGSGQKVGQIVRLSKIGLLCETWEGELIRGGMTDGSGTVGTVPFHFTVENQALVEKALDCMTKQTEVVVFWQQEGVYSACRSESGGAFLTAIERLPVERPR